MKEMSVQQKKVYDFIERYHCENGISPSMAEIADSLGLGHTTVATYVDVLKKKGFVAGKRGTPRTLRVIPASHCFRLRKRFLP
jgi:SOS-response transcriptional repressor LexA